MLSLSDEFEIKGNSFDGFKTAVKEMAQGTSCRLVESDKVIFYHYIEGPKTLKKILSVKPDALDGGKRPFYVFDRTSLEENNEENHEFRVGLIAEDVFSDAQWDKDIENGEKLVVKIGNDKFTISELAMNTLFQRAGLSGKSLVTPDLQRNIFLAHSFLANDRLSGQKPQKINVIYREEDGENGRKYKKIFAFLGRYYAYIPQTFLITLAEELMKDGALGTGEVYSWGVDQQRSYILIEFPQAAEDIQDAYKLPDKMIPGLYLATSDTGENSIVCRGTLRHEKSSLYIVTEEVKRKHLGDVNAEEITDKAKETIFANVRILPEVLSRLIGQSVKDYSKTDLSTPAGQEENRAAVSALIKRVWKKTADVFSKKTSTALLEAMTDEIDPSRRYSYYDVAVAFMDLPERVEGISRKSSAFVEFQRRCAKAPFLVEKAVSSPATTPADDEDEDIFLV